MKIEILKVENGNIVDPDYNDMPACMTGCGGGGGGGTPIPVEPFCFSAILCICGVLPLGDFC